MRPPRFVRFFQHLNWATLKTIFQQAGQRRLMGLSAEMAYNAMLALFPAILAILTAIGLFQSPKSAFEGIAAKLSEVAPQEVLFLIQGFVQEISLSHNQGLFSISFIAAIWASSGALSAAMTALDQIHEIPQSQVRPFWKAKLVSLALTIGTIVLLITASFVVFISDIIIQLLVRESGFWEVLSFWRLLSWPLALGIVSIASGFVYRYGPSRWVPGTPIMPGAILAAVLWAIVSAGFRLYVSNFGNYNRAYGAVGAVIVLMLWLYVTSLVLLIGDQLNVTVGDTMRHKTKGKKEASKPVEITKSTD